MAYCPNCGARVMDNATECAACGAVFTTDGAWQPVDTKPPTPAAKKFEAGDINLLWRLVISMCFFGYAGALLLEQVVYWLRFQDWVELPLLYLFVAPPVEMYYTQRENPFWLLPTWFVGDWAWIHSPQSWFGLHQIAHKTLASLHFGVLPVALGIWLLVTDLFEPSTSTQNKK